MPLRARVIAWCKENFVMDEFSVTDFPLMPGGVILTDENGGKMLVYWDVTLDQIAYEMR